MNTMPQNLNEHEAVGTFAPLREASFRKIWVASVFSNFAQLFLGVGAAWKMTQLTTSPSMVALVQTAMMLPMVVVSLPAGAIALLTVSVNFVVDWQLHRASGLKE